MAVFFDRVVETANHILPFGVGFHLGQILCHCLTRHREAIPVKQAFVEEHFHQWSQTANSDQLGHDIFPAGFEIRQHRHPATNAGEIIDAQLHPGRMRHGEHVQDRIGRSSQCGDHGQGILKCLSSHDVARAYSPFEQTHDRLS